MGNQVLVDAIQQRESAYAHGVYRALDAIENDPEVYDDVSVLREAVELVRCLRRVVPHLTVDQIHKAFGAPGDFGYETLIGNAMSRLYRGDNT